LRAEFQNSSFDSLDSYIRIKQGHYLILSVDERQARRSAVRERNRFWSGCSREGVEHRLLKRRISACIAKYVIEDAIVENPVGSANRGFAILKWIPRESNSRLYVAVVVMVNIVTGSRAHLSECE
jgi:hypothetical protein